MLCAPPPLALWACAPCPPPPPNPAPQKGLAGRLKLLHNLPPHKAPGLRSLAPPRGGGGPSCRCELGEGRGGGGPEHRLAGPDLIWYLKMQQYGLNFAGHCGGVQGAASNATPPVRIDSWRGSSSVTAPVRSVFPRDASEQQRGAGTQTVAHQKGPKSIPPLLRFIFSHEIRVQEGGDCQPF